MAAAHLRVLAAALALLTLSGCGFVHFGRLPTSDPRLVQESSDLRLEKTILQQELAIAHKEGDALRTALEARAGGGARESDLAAQLESTTRDLAALRVRYASLRDEQTRLPASPGGAETGVTAASLQARLTATEDHLAATLRDYTQLRDENGRLRQDLDRVRGENAALAVQVRDLGTQNRETQAALTQLNSELLAQKESRARAEQATEALRAQLHTVIGQSPPPTLDGAREAAASSVSTIETAGLHVPPLPAAGSPPTATISNNPKRVPTATAPGPAGKTAAEPAVGNVAPTAAAAPRIHRVAADETLGTIAMKYYGSPERWRVIADANGALLRDGHPLTQGMELVIPGGPAPAP